MRKWMRGLALAGVIVVVVVVATAVWGILQRSGTALAVPQRHTRGDLICLTYPHMSVDYCMNLHDNKFHADQPIVLYNAKQGNGLGWHRVALGKVTATAPLKNASWDAFYQGDTYYYLEKTTATGHNGCVGIALRGPNTLSVAWEPCGADDTRWIWDKITGQLVNIGLTNTGHLVSPAVAAECSRRTPTNGTIINPITLNSHMQLPRGCYGTWFFKSGSGG